MPLEQLFQEYNIPPDQRRWFRRLARKWLTDNLLPDTPQNADKNAIIQRLITELYQP